MKHLFDTAREARDRLIVEGTLAQRTGDHRLAGKLADIANMLSRALHTCEDDLK
jgi:hypothetical protein